MQRPTSDLQDFQLARTPRTELELTWLASSTPSTICSRAKNPRAKRVAKWADSAALRGRLTPSIATTRRNARCYKKPHNECNFAGNRGIRPALDQAGAKRPLMNGTTMALIGAICPPTASPYDAISC